MQDGTSFDPDTDETSVRDVAGETERNGPPWENPDETGTVRGLLETLYGSMFGPARFFSQMRRRDGYLSPLIYAVILGSFSVLVSIGWECLFVSSGGSLLDAGANQQLSGLRAVSYGLTAVLSPVMIVVLVFVSSGVFHIVLSALGGATQGFQASFRVVCYSQGTGVCNIIPFFGPAIGGIWNLVLLVTGLARSHGTSSWKAVAAVLIPVIVSSILIAAMLLVVGGQGLSLY